MRRSICPERKLALSSRAVCNRRGDKNRDLAQRLCTLPGWRQAGEGNSLGVHRGCGHRSGRPTSCFRRRSRFWAKCSFQALSRRSRWSLTMSTICRHVRASKLSLRASCTWGHSQNFLPPQPCGHGHASAREGVPRSPSKMSVPSRAGALTAAGFAVYPDAVLTFSRSVASQHAP